MPLRNIKYFMFFLLPDDLSHPNSIFNYISSGVPLSLLDWLKYACPQARELAQNGNMDVGRSISRVIVQFALGEERNQTEWDEAADLVEDIECIPTNEGLRFPADSYIDGADICWNLPRAEEASFNIPMTCVADAGGVQYKTVTSEHVRKVLINLRVSLP